MLYIVVNNVIANVSIALAVLVNLRLILISISILLGGGEQPSSAPVDAYGDPLPKDSLRRFGTLRCRNEKYDHVVSADGRYYATIRSKFSKDISVCETKSGKVIAGFMDLETPQIMAITFLPEGLLTAGGLGGSIVIWDCRKGKELRRVKTGQDVYRLAAGAAGDSFASAGMSSGITIWSIRSLQPLHRLPSKAGISSLAYAPTGDILLVADATGTISMWDTKSGRLHRQLAAFPEDNRFSKSGSYIIQCALSPDGTRVAAVNRDGEFVLLDAKTGARIPQSEIPQQRVKSFCFSPDSSIILTRAQDSSVRRRDAHSGKDRGILIERLPSEFDLQDMHFAADGKTLVTSGIVIKRWDAATGRELHPLNAHCSYILAIDCSRDGQLVATGSQDGTARLWDAITGKHIALLDDRMRSVYSVVFPGNGDTLLTTGAGGSIRVWDRKGNLVTRLEGHPGAILTLACTPDGNTLLSGGEDCIIRCWDLRTHKITRQLVGPTRPIRHLCISPDGTRAVSLDDDHFIRIWDLTTGAELKTMRAEKDDPWYGAIALSPDGKLLATLQSAKCCIWEVATGQRVRAVSGAGVAIGTPEFLTARLLVTNGNNFLGLLHIPSNEWQPGPNFDADLHCMAIVPANSRIFTGHRDTTAYSWDIGAGFQKALARIEERKTKPNEESLRSAWKALGSKSAAEAYRGVWTLADGDKRAVALLRDHLHPMVAVDAKLVATLVAQLDDEVFEVREKAFIRLKEMGERSLPSLRTYLLTPITAEVRTKLAQLISQANQLSPERLQGLRAIQALEYIGTKEARDLLNSLAQGNPSMQLTIEAVAALRRLK